MSGFKCCTGCGAFGCPRVRKPVPAGGQCLALP
jgi:hypothetical protein